MTDSWRVLWCGGCGKEMAHYLRRCDPCEHSYTCPACLNIVFLPLRWLAKMPKARAATKPTTELEMSIEKMVRNVLEVAIREGLVMPGYRANPQDYSSGELTVTANLMNSFIAGRDGRKKGALEG